MFLQVQRLVYWHCNHADHRARGCGSARRILSIALARCVGISSFPVGKRTTMNRAGELVMGLVICATVVAASNWEIEIHFHQYSNPSGLRSNGNCCAAQCVCEVQFRICLRPGDYDLSLGNRCPYTDFTKITSMYTLANFIAFNDTINDLENPVIFSAGGELEEVPASGLSLFVRIRDVGSDSNPLVDRVFASIEGIGSSANSTSLIGEFGNVELIISYDVRCQQNYYGIDCLTHCLPSDNSTGHYNCDPSNGNKICLSGYQNPNTGCTEVACELVCTGEGGNCSESGECVCSQGWSGEDCGQAQCTNNCHPVGGYCNLPGECLCHTHWNGTDCDQFLCHPNCSTVGGTCVMAGGCDCLTEYTGEYCETDLNPCSHLTPCENGGTCSNGDPNQYSCACPSGYSGKDCEEDIDECTSSPCAVQSTCIDHPGSYQCLCVQGWTGELCETNIDDCSSQPCLNGGSCFDQIDDYYCTCPVEYVGHNCALLRNGCIPSPCQHNGTCMDMITDYLCLCSEGYSGKQCEVTITDISVQMTPTQTPQEGGDGALLIYGLTCGGVVLILLVLLSIVLLLTYLLRRRKMRSMKNDSKPGHSGAEDRVYDYVDLEVSHSDVSLEQCVKYESSKKLNINTVPNEKCSMKNDSKPGHFGAEDRVYNYVDLEISQPDVSLEQCVAYQSSKKLNINTAPNACYGLLGPVS